MKESFSTKHLFAAVATAIITSLCATVSLHQAVADSWGYAELGVGDGTTVSPVFYSEVRRVGKHPTVARIVRLHDHSTAPGNTLEFSQQVLPELDSRMRNFDRWNGEFTNIADRSNDETVEVAVDKTIAEKWFGRPGTPLERDCACEPFFARYLPNADHSRAIGAFDELTDANK